MAVTKKLIHDYANCKDNPISAQDVLRSYKVILSGYPFSFRSNPDERIFYSEAALEGYVKGYPTGNPFIKETRSKESLRVMDANEFVRLANHINEINERLEACQHNPFALANFIPDVFKKAVEMGAITSAPIPGHTWHYGIVISAPILERRIPIEDLVEIVGLLIPLHALNSDLKLEYTKKCLVCGDFYQAKGEKALYCSERCRSRARFQTKKVEK